MNKKAIADEIIVLLQMLVEPDTEPKIEAIPDGESPVEMLTIKECARLIKGVSEHTVRLLVAQNKIPYVRAGQGKNGKILIPKNELLKYFKCNEQP